MLAADPQAVVDGAAVFHPFIEGILIPITPARLLVAPQNGEGYPRHGIHPAR